MVASKQIKILTVDDRPILREGIASIIQGENPMVVVGEASPGGIGSSALVKVDCFFQNDS
jgi:DNA-binding NarL/FixJ family response regulator